MNNINIEILTLFAIGIVLCVIGAINMSGNISSLHSYHRHRVTPENVKPFGRLVGSGTALIGLSIIAFGVFMIAYEKTQLDVLLWIGTALLIACIVAGLGISFYAMIKYNKGIF